MSVPTPSDIATQATTLQNLLSSLPALPDMPPGQIASHPDHAKKETVLAQIHDATAGLHSMLAEAALVQLEAARESAISALNALVDWSAVAGGQLAQSNALEGISPNRDWKALYGRIGGWFSSYAIPTCNWEGNTIGHKLVTPETNSASLLALATSFQTLIAR
jgi:hypothetical protein